jgi:hypothetical protein
MNLLFYERYESIITKEEKKRSSYDNSFFFRLKYLFKDFLHASHYRVFNYSNIFLEEQKGKREREEKRSVALTKKKMYVTIYLVMFFFFFQ